jgi:predicted site-specific integrase-resolvase
MSGVSVRTLWRRIKDGTLKVEYSDTGRVFINVEDDTCWFSYLYKWEDALDEAFW